MKDRDSVPGKNISSLGVACRRFCDPHVHPMDAEECYAGVKLVKDDLVKR
jgi:hypothetical protein